MKGIIQMKRVDLRLGNCLDVLKQIPDNSIDACVSDPPYGISFLNAKWDYDVPKSEIWKEVLRVLKPGGHLLAFFGTRTYHRGVVNIEDAGFEVRDQLSWVYGSGFPKSTDISKQLDKMNGAEREVIGTSKSGGYKRIMETNAEHGYRPENYYDEGNKFVSDEPVTDEAKQWHGWGTGLKPAQEPIVLARKPFKGTIARNVLKYGTGAININNCRVGTEVLPEIKAGQARIGTFERNDMVTPERVGRYPANLIHDGSEEVLELFPDTAPSKSGGVTSNVTTMHLSGLKRNEPHPRTGHDDDGGSAARFFYCAKPSVSEKEAGLEELQDSTLNRVNSGGLENDPKWAPKTRKNNHPTVKPVKLMQYLCRLITPPGGTVLDPFMGSGTTGMAAVSEGFDFLGIELDEHYLEIARARIAHYNKEGEE